MRYEGSRADTHCKVMYHKYQLSAAKWRKQSSSSEHGLTSSMEAKGRLVALGMANQRTCGLAVHLPWDLSGATGSPVLNDDKIRHSL